MKFKHLVIILILIPLFGCSSTHLIQSDDRIHIKKYGTLFKKDFERIDVSEFYASGDSIIAIDHDTNELLQFHKSDVKKIVMRDRSKGAKQGAIYTALGALVLALVLPNNPDDALGSRGAAIIILPTLYSPIGALVGYAAGSNDTYVFSTARARANNAIKVNEEISDEETPPTIIDKVKEQVSESKEVKEKMLSASKKPIKPTYFYFSLGSGVGIGKIPAIKNSIKSVIIKESGLGVGGIFQFWVPIKSNIYVGFSAGGFETSQETGNIITARSVENFGITTRIYPKKNSYYYNGAIGFSRLSQRSRFTDKLSDFFDSSINGMSITAGMGTSFIKGGNYELLLNSDVSFNFFEGGEKSYLIKFYLGVMFPRRRSK